MSPNYGWTVIGVTLALGSFARPSRAQYVIDTVAGNYRAGDGGPAMAARLVAADGLAVDPAGNLFIADSADHRVRKVNTATGLIGTVAGTGLEGLFGDGGPGTEAMVNRPYGLAADEAGTLYIADFGNGRVRRLGANGIIETVAGEGTNGAGMEGAARAARLAGPRNVATDAQGNLFISDFVVHTVYQVTPDGQIRVIAGTGASGYSPGSGIATAMPLNGPAGLAAGPDGALYIADSGNGRVCKVVGGMITTVLDRTPDDVPLANPAGLTIDRYGTLYVADSGNRRVIQLTRYGDATVTASAIDGLQQVRDVAVDARGIVYVADGRRVMAILAPGAVVPIAGMGDYGSPPDGVPAEEAPLDGPIGVAVDRGGNLYIAEEGAYRVRMVDREGKIRVVAGTGERGVLVDGMPARDAKLTDPVAVAVDPSGRVWIAEYASHRIRRVDRNGTITSVAGDGQPGYNGEGLPMYATQLHFPRALAADGAGNIFVADSLNHRVRRISPGGPVFTVAGSGIRGYAGDGGHAVLAQFDRPSGVAVDREGNLFIADRNNHVIRQVTSEGYLHTMAGTGAPGYSGDGGPATAARLNYPSAVAVDSQGRVWIADTNNHRVRMIAQDGVIETVAGDGNPGYSGDGGPAESARLRYPSGIAVTGDGTVYIADLDNRRIRRLTPLQFATVQDAPGDCRLVHGATFQPGPVAPGQLVSIFGTGIGPVEPAGAMLDAAGVLERTVARTRVRFGETDAPLLYVSAGQINAQAPYSLTGRESTPVEVFYQGVLRCRAEISVTGAAPGIFTLENGTGQAAAVNSDGTPNSADNPAPRGSFLTLYATGEGQTDPSGKEGAPARAPLAVPVQPVHLRIAGFPVDVLYAGAAPGFAGLMQINVQLPSGFFPKGNLPVTLYVGGVASQPGVTVLVQ